MTIIFVPYTQHSITVASGGVKEKAQAIEKSIKRNAKKMANRTSRVVKGAAAEMERKVEIAKESFMEMETEATQTVVKIEKEIEQKVAEECGLIQSYMSSLVRIVKDFPSRCNTALSSFLLMLSTPLWKTAGVFLRMVEAICCGCAYFWSIIVGIDKSMYIPSVSDIRLSLPSLSFSNICLSCPSPSKLYMICSTAFISDDERVHILESKIYSLRTELASAQMEISNLKKEIGVFQMNCKHHCERLRLAEESNVELETEVQEKKSLIEKLHLDLKETNNAVRKTEGIKEALEAEISARTEQVHLLEAEIIG